VAGTPTEMAIERDERVVVLAAARALPAILAGAGLVLRGAAPVEAPTRGRSA